MHKLTRRGAREIIYKVFLRCMAEYEAGQLLSGVEDIYKRTADYTGVSESSVRRIAKEGAENGGKFISTSKHREGRPSKNLSSHDVSVIRRKILYFYAVRKEIPTINKLLHHVQSLITYNASREHFRKVLKMIGFKYVRTKIKKLINAVLIEKPLLAHKRENYLQTIIKNRTLPVELQKDIIFLNESYISTSCEIKQCWQSFDKENVSIDNSKRLKWIIIYAGTEKGLLSNGLAVFSPRKQDGDIEMNRINFKKWISEILIPNISEPSIIVMDLAPYHSEVKNKTPNAGSNFDDITSWLQDNKIPFDNNLRKPSLIEIVKKHKPDPIYEIDDILNQNGHTVIRIPPLHCDLNPLEAIWSKIETIVSENFNAKDLKKMAEEAFKSVTKDDWIKSGECVKTLEKEYYDRGQIVYDVIDNLADLDDEESTDEDDLSSDGSEDDTPKIIKDKRSLNKGASTSSIRKITRRE